MTGSSWFAVMIGGALRKQSAAAMIRTPPAALSTFLPLLLSGLLGGGLRLTRP